MQGGTSIAKLLGTINPNQVLKDVLGEESLKPIRGKVLMNPSRSVTVIVERTLEHEWRNTHWLREVSEIPASKRAEAKLVFIIPEFAEGYDSISDELREQAEKLSQGRICIVLPRSSVMLSAADLRRLAALQYLARSDEVIAHEQRMRIVNSRLEAVEDRVGSALSRFLLISNYAFYIDRREVAVKSFDEAMEFLFHNLYPQFPRIRMESVSGRGVTNPVINSLIADKSRTLPHSDQSVDARFIRDAMPAMGLVGLRPCAGGQVASLTIPRADHDAYSIWREVADALARKHKPIESLYSTLTAPPYGLSYFLIEVYMSTYLALKKGALIDLQTSRVESSPSANLASLVTKHKDARFLVVPPGKSVEALRHFMISVWQMAAEAVGLRSHKNIDVRTIDDQALWYNEIRPTLRLYVERVVEPVREALAELGISRNHVDHLRNRLLEVITSPDYIVPDKAYEWIFELCKELPRAPSEVEEVEVDQNVAFYRLKPVNDACASLLEDDASGKRQVLEGIEAISAIREVTGNIVAPEHKPLAEDAASKFSRLTENVFDIEARRAFVTSVRALWESYAETHQTEHDIIMQLRSSFGTDILRSPVYHLLEQLSPLSSQLGFREASYFRKEVEDVRSTSHEAGQRARFPAVRCPDCGEFSSTGDSQKETESLILRSSTLSESVWSAALGCLQKMAALDEQEDFRDYISNVEKPAAQKVWQHFVGVMQSGEKALRKNAEDLLNVAADLVRLIGRFWEYGQRPGPPVRIPADHVAEAFRDFILRQGIAEYSFEELASRVKTWLERIKQERFTKRE